MRDFDGRVAFVAGGSQGIGLAAAKQLAARGAHVAIFARRPEVLAQAASEIESRRRSREQRVVWRSLDVADHEKVGEAMSACVADIGTPDLLLNCAGRARPDYFENITPERFDETLRINLHGCWNTVSALVPHMKNRRGSYIVNTSSLAGLIGVFGYTDYCASKFALVGFSEALRAEVARYGMTVSVLCPPDTDTPGFAAENIGKPPETVAASEGGGVMSAEAVAEELFRGMARRRFLIIPGREGRVAHLAKRLAPGLVERIVRRRVAAVSGPR